MDQHVLSIPVWIHFYKIPSVLKHMIGLDLLASLVGKAKCLDTNIMATKRLVYAKSLIEITLDKPMPLKLREGITDGHEVEVVFRHSWKPNICTSCRSFGHTVDSCKFGAIEVYVLTYNYIYHIQVRYYSVNPNPILLSDSLDYV